MKTYLPVSICMAYYNRFELLKNTIESIISKDFLPNEIVIVDDASFEKLTFEHLHDVLFGLDVNVNIYNFTKEEKTWINPVIAFNKAVSLAKNEVIIIQNPECYHKTNIVKKYKNIHKKEYVSMACYSLSNLESPFSEIEYNNYSATFDGESAWYNHSLYRPKYYHFCSMLYKEDFVSFGGFNVDMQNGIGYDDDALIYDLQTNGVSLYIDDSEIVYHQYHSISHNQDQTLIDRNRKIYYSMMESK